MKITEFFKEELKAPLTNQVWSWGATDDRNRVFLRIWDGEKKLIDGKRSVLVLRVVPIPKSLGFPERKRHLDLIRSGRQAFGVWVTAVDQDVEGPKRVKTYCQDYVVKLGPLCEKANGDIYAFIGKEIPVKQVRVPSEIPVGEIPSQKELSKFEKLVFPGINVSEGETVTLTRQARVRCEKLRDYARYRYRKDGVLYCAICSWHNPAPKMIKGDIVEIHHLDQLAQLPGKGNNQPLEKALRRVQPLCPNCHRIVHSRKADSSHPFSLMELKKLVGAARRGGVNRHLS